MGLLKPFCSKEVILTSLLSLYLLFFSVSNNFSQQSLHFDFIGLKDGLPGGTWPVFFVQDNRGFVWFNINGGVAKYDGYTIKPYTSLHGQDSIIYFPEIFSMCLDKENNIWIGSENRIGLYDIVKDNFTSFEIVSGKDSIGSVKIYSIAEGKDGKLWLGSGENGIYSFDKNTKEVKQIKNDDNISSEITKLIVDDNGFLWISYYDKGIRRYDPDKNLFTNFLHNENDSSSIYSDSVFAMFKDSSGIIWIAFKNKVIAELNTQTFKFQYYFIKGNGVNSEAPINCILKDDEGLVWLGVHRDNIILFNKDKNEFISVNSSNNSPQNPGVVSTTCLYQDRSGVIWFGGREVINKFTNKKQKFFNFSDDTDYNKHVNGAGVHAITGDNEGNIWIGTINGLYKYETNSGKYIHFFPDSDVKRDPKKFGPNWVRGLLIDRSGILWVAVGNSFCKFNTTNGNYITYNHDPNDTNSLAEEGCGFIFEDSFGDLWVCSDEKLQKFNRNTSLFKNYAIPTIRTVYEDSEGVLWAASGSRGLYRYNRETDKFTEYYNEESFRSFSVVVEDNKNRLWVASFSSGINSFDRKTGLNVSFDDKKGLSSNFVNNLIEDKAGMLWLSTRIGISRFDPDKKYFKNYDEKDGLKFTGFETTSTYKSTDGKLYFGGRNGMVSFIPAPINTNIPNVVITDFKVHNASTNPSDTSLLHENINIVKDINLDYKDNTFSFEFAALDFRSPERNQYAYKMEGFDEDWVLPGVDRIANYTNLSEGEYIFRVKGSNDDNVWNEEGASIKIIVSPPWWRTWWFTTTWIFIALTIFGGSIRFISTQKLKRKLRKVEQQQALDAERMRISKDMHDEVGSSLSRITLLSEIASKKAGDIDEIKKISKASREVVNNMDEIVWAVNPKNDSLENLSAYVLQYSQEYFESSSLTCRFEYPQVIPEIKLSSDVRHNIFLCIKEALNNIFKHSGASIVIISLKIYGNIFEFSILDNGKGFDPGQIDRFSNGLNNMRRRIDDINGEFKIESTLHQGVRIIIKIRYEQN